MFAPMNSTQCS